MTRSPTVAVAQRSPPPRFGRTVFHLRAAVPQPQPRHIAEQPLHASTPRCQLPPECRGGTSGAFAAQTKEAFQRQRRRPIMQLPVVRLPYDASALPPAPRKAPLLHPAAAREVCPLQPRAARGHWRERPLAHLRLPHRRHRGSRPRVRRRRHESRAPHAVAGAARAFRARPRGVLRNDARSTAAARARRCACSRRNLPAPASGCTCGTILRAKP